MSTSSSRCSAAASPSGPPPASRPGRVSVVLGTGCNSVFGLQNGVRRLPPDRHRVGAHLSEPWLPTRSTRMRRRSAPTSTRRACPATAVTRRPGWRRPAPRPPASSSTRRSTSTSTSAAAGSTSASHLRCSSISSRRPAPTGVKIQGGDEALVLNWQSVDQALMPDLLGYQILCSRADQYQVFKEVGERRRRDHTGPFSRGLPDLPQTRTGTGVEGLDPTFVCSPQLSAKRPPTGWRSCRTTSPTPPRWSPSTTAATRASRSSATARPSRR